MIYKPLEKTETEVTHHVCPFHQKYPSRTYAGCTCSSTYTLRKAKNDSTQVSRVQRKRKGK